MQTPVHHGPRMSLGGTSPTIRTSRTASPPMGMDGNFGTSHVPRIPTPPMRTDGLVTNVSTHSQSPSLPGQRHDVILPNVSSPQPNPANIQLPTRTLGPGPQARPSGLTASQFLGSLVDSRLPSGARNSRAVISNTQGIPSAPANLVPSSGVPLTPSSSTGMRLQKGVEHPTARVAGQAVTSSSNCPPKTDSLSSTHMPEARTSAAGTANGDKRNLNGTYPPSTLSGSCNVSQSKMIDQSAHLKSAQAEVTASCQETRYVVKKGIVVNGTAQEATVLDTKTVLNASQAKLPAAVNG